MSTKLSIVTKIFIFFIGAISLIFLTTHCGKKSLNPVDLSSYSADTTTSLKAILSYSLSTSSSGSLVNGTISGQNITVVMPFGTSLNSLIATFTISGKMVQIGSTTQVSGETTNNFTSSKTYTVTAIDGSTQNYLVTVTVASAADKSLLTFSLNGTSGIITGQNIAVTMPFGTNITALVATFSFTGASVKIGSTSQTSGTTANNFTTAQTYTVAAANGTTQNYTVTVTVASNTAKALLAFSLNGTPGVITGQNISVTMPFGTTVTALVASFITTGASVKIGATTQTSGVTANDFTAPVTYIVTASNASTLNYTVTVTVAANSAKAITAFSLNGTPGVITGQNIAVTMPNGTSVTNLIATYTTTGSSVKIGTTTQASGVTSNDYTNAATYVVTAADNSTQNYTVTVSVAGTSAKDITAFSLNGATGTIVGQTINVTAPIGSTLAALTASFTTTGASVKIGATTQTSGLTLNDFTAAVVYIVTAADNSTQNYTVNAKVLTSIAVTPANAQISKISTQQYTATGTYSDASTVDLTSSVTWASSDTSKATINASTGLATAVVAGTTTISATYSSLSNSTTLAVGQYIYVSNNGSSKITKCSFNAFTGILSSCSQQPGAGSINGPRQIHINGNYIYVATNNGAGDLVKVCDINTSDGTLSNCGNTGSGVDYQGGFLINGGYGFIGSDGLHQIFSCPVNVNGRTLDACTMQVDTGAAGANNLVDLMISGNYIYAAKYGNNTIKRCTLAGVGVVNSCQDLATVALLNGPYTMNVSGSYLYIGQNSAANNIISCSFNSAAGTVSGCAVAATLGYAASGFGIFGGYAYILNWGGNVYSCPVNGDGTLGTVGEPCSSRTAIAAGNFSNPIAKIAFW